MTSSTSRFPVWLIVLSGCVICAMGFGPRATMGFFLAPMTEARGWSRETFALAFAIQNLAWGLAQPVLGMIADRYGTARVLALGGVLYAAGLVAMSYATAPLALHLGAGVVIGVAVASCSFGIVMAAFGRRVGPEHRTQVFGLATAAASFGQFLFAPVTQGFIDAYGWESALLILAGIMLLVPLLAIPLSGRPPAGANTRLELSATQALGEALGHRSYVLLAAGFFVCGFQIAFITVHFPAYLRDVGLDPTWGAWALGLIGLFNIVGSLSAGLLGARFPKQLLLAALYASRAVVITVFLLVPVTPVGVVIFAALMGLMWLSTVPLTNGLVAVFFGTRWLAMLGGVVFLAHQIGSFLGVWLGGYLYDVTGTYEMVWWLSVALGLVAALIHLPIQERPVTRLAGAPA